MSHIFKMVFLFLFLSVPRIDAQDAPPLPQPHFYELAYGTVQYNIAGAIKGTETLYFDQWGMRQARYRVAETQRFGTSTTITLNLRGEILLIDPNKRLGQKRTDPDLKQVLAGRRPDDPQLISLEMIALMGGEKGKGQNFLDRPCDVWENKKTQTKMWVWNGIPLKTETQTPDGVVTYTVIKIDENTAVDASVFAAPEGVRFIDQDINQILISLRSGK